MKILKVIETLGHGGAETVATNLAIGLRDHDLRLIHYSSINQQPPHQAFIQRMQAAGIPVFDVHWRELQIPELRQKLLGDWQPDVVIFHWWKGHPLYRWMNQTATAAPSDRPSFLCVLHNQGNPDGPRYDRYVAVTPSQLGNLSTAVRQRTRVIPNGIDLAPFLRLQPHNNGNFTIGRLSSLRPGKLPQDWITTAAGFDIPDAHWIIAGDGSLRPLLQASARALGVAEQFNFPGYVHEVQRPELFSRFTVGCYVTGHLGEGHPLSLMETAAAGVPIVAERRGGIPDIVRDGVNGLLADSIDEIGRHLRRLRHDPGLRRELSGGARDLADRFSLQHQLADYRSLIEELR